MKFNSEEEMKNYVSKRLVQDVKRIYPHNFEPYLFDEVPYSVGRTDLVTVNISLKYFDKRVNKLKLKEPIKKDFYLQVYLRLKSMYLNEIYIEEIDKEFNIEKNKMAHAINWLVDNGFLERQGNKILFSKKFNKHVTMISAFELKLSDWKRALNQAINAKSYSNMQFVVLDHNHINPAIKNLNKFEEMNIGLISINPHSNCKIHFYPKKIKEPFSSFGIWRINEYTLPLIQNKLRC